MEEHSRKNMPERAELHAHLGSSVDPPILWSIAHAQGIRLPSKNYWDFEDMITMRGEERNTSIDEMDKNFYHWTELIQSSPLAIEESVKSVIGGGYRKCNLVLQELRFNPMKRNRGGEQDLDHIIMAALRGMDKAVLEYPKVRAGIILMMDRTFSYEKISIIVKKAISYKNRGVIGIDLAGPHKDTFSMKEHATLFLQAREAGLGITVHTGEEGDISELKNVVEHIRPNRIGHGILAIKDPSIMKSLSDYNITLESCPSSNIKNSCIQDLKELKELFATYKKNGLTFTINTDGPEMYRTNVYKEEQLLIENEILSKSDIEQCRKNAFSATFIPTR